MSTEEQAEGEETRDEATTNGLSEDIDDEQFTATEPDEPSVADPVTTEDIAPEADLAVTGGLDEKTQEAPEAPNAEDMLNAFPYREQALGETTPERAHSLPPSPSFSPPRYESIGESDRRAIHSKLRAYENRRRMAYTTKLESSSLYWRSFRELLSASVHETARAERMVLGTAMANKAYAESMQASYDDVFLDDRGAIVNDLKKQKKLLDIRSIQAYDVAPIGKTEEGKRFTVKVPEERKSNMLHTLIESQLEISSKFGENAETLGAEIATEISDLRKALAAKVTEINLIGDTIIGELEKTETEVSDAWGKVIHCPRSRLQIVFTRSSNFMLRPQRLILLRQPNQWVDPAFRPVCNVVRVLATTYPRMKRRNLLTTAWMSGSLRCTTEWPLPTNHLLGKRDLPNYPNFLLQ